MGGSFSYNFGKFLSIHHSLFSLQRISLRKFTLWSFLFFSFTFESQSNVTMALEIVMAVLESSRNFFGFCYVWMLNSLENEIWNFEIAPPCHPKGQVHPFDDTGEKNKYIQLLLNSSFYFIRNCSLRPIFQCQRICKHCAVCESASLWTLDTRTLPKIFWNILSKWTERATLYIFCIVFYICWVLLTFLRAHYCLCCTILLKHLSIWNYLLRHNFETS